MLIKLTRGSASRIVSAVLILCSVGAYIFSLSLPAYKTESGTDWSAKIALLYGVLDLLGLHVPWLANPLLLASWITWLTFTRLSLILAACAFVASLAFWIGEGQVQVPTGSSSSTYVALSGYYVWLLSTIFQLLAAVLRFATLEKSSARKVASTR